MWSAEKKLRIGTRESALATWQAKFVQDLLTQHYIESELIFIKTVGDVDLTTPLYELGVQGIFTKSLDAALLDGRIDIAVHSMKDVPIVLAHGLVQAAVLERASYKDLLVWHDDIKNPSEDLLMHQIKHTIATSSVRRRAQWLNKYPQATIENIRGNVNTRLKKLQGSQWQGAIFAAAGLERIGLRSATAIDLDWMLPAPAQGAILVLCRGDEETIKSTISLINHSPTETCTAVERSILHLLKGGCSTPISALATLQHEQMRVEASVLSLDGKEKVEVENSFALKDFSKAATIMVDELLAKGADRIIENLNKDENF